MPGIEGGWDGRRLRRFASQSAIDNLAVPFGKGHVPQNVALSGTAPAYPQVSRGCRLGRQRDYLIMDALRRSSTTTRMVPMARYSPGVFGRWASEIDRL